MTAEDVGKPRKGENRGEGAGNPPINNNSTDVKKSPIQKEQNQFRVDAERAADRLINAFLNDRIRTIGQINQFLWRFWYLPEDLKDTVWNELAGKIDRDFFRELHARFDVYKEEQMQFMLARRARRKVR